MDLWFGAGSAVRSLNPACKTPLPPCLEHRHRDGVREVEAALAGEHRQAEASVFRKFGHHVGGQAARFAAEDKHIVEVECDLVGACAPSGRDRKQAPSGQRRLAVRPVRVAEHLRELVVIKSGALDRAVRPLAADRRDRPGDDFTVDRPDVDESAADFTVTPRPGALGDKVIRFGLGAIRNVGKNAVDAIIAERENGHGKYVNFTDFIKRVPLEALNRRLVESLIKAGAFDSIDPNRRALFTIHETAINSVVGLKRKQAEGQFDLFADLDDSKENDSAMGDAMVQVPDVEEWDKKTKLNFEREMLGLYVSDHPLSGMQSILVSLREMSIAHLIDRAGSMPDGQQVTIAGLITNVDRRVSKKGNPWAIVTVEDLESSIQCMFFGKVYEAAAPELAVDTVVQIRGQVEKRDETVSMRATEFTVPTLEAQDERPLTIVLPPIALDQSHVRRLGQILTSHPGPCEVKLALMDDKGNAKVLTFGDRFRVKRDTSLFAEIKILFGPSSLPLA